MNINDTLTIYFLLTDKKRRVRKMQKKISECNGSYIETLLIERYVDVGNRYAEEVPIKRALKDYLHAMCEKFQNASIWHGYSLDIHNAAEHYASRYLHCYGKYCNRKDKDKAIITITPDKFIKELIARAYTVILHKIKAGIR